MFNNVKKKCIHHAFLIVQLSDHNSVTTLKVLFLAAADFKSHFKKTWRTLPAECQTAEQHS